MRADCCVDGDCNEITCMNLPAAKTCAECAHLRRCVAIFGVKPENTSCDFYPRKFLPVVASEVP